MWRIPRLAVGTVQPNARCQPLLWGLLTALSQAGLAVRTFGSRASFASHDASRCATGRPRRYLDTWVMDGEQTTTAFQKGMHDCHLGLIEGEFAAATNRVDLGGSLELVCDRLDSPRIAALDLSLMDGCRIPARPERLDGILLSRAKSGQHALHWQATLEPLWSVPVLGWLEESDPIDALLDYLPASQAPARSVCLMLAESLRGTLRRDALLEIAERASTLPAMPMETEPSWNPRIRTTVAIAMDEAFTNYFPETLEQLESAGVALRDFSPLRGEAIPEETDVVYLGGGGADRFWPKLAANHCLAQSLRSFAGRGGRVYAEGTGLAYLCRQVELLDGSTQIMTGLLPATARQVDRRPRFEPLEIEFGAPSWLFDSESPLRGYRDSSWQIEPTGPMLTFARGENNRLDVLGRRNVIGSRLAVHFASQRSVLRRLGAPTPLRHFVPAMVERKE
jgi:cobyrinic acid a,c-diamide synthase